MFTITSRYAKVADAVHDGGGGGEIVYKRLRILPRPASIRSHRVMPEDRLDLLAHSYLGDPEQFWRIVDANLELMPPTLVAVVGRRIRIPLQGS